MAGIIAVYLWFIGMDGNVGKGNTVADVDMSFGDIWDNLDIGGRRILSFGGKSGFSLLILFI